MVDIDKVKDRVGDEKDGSSGSTKSSGGSPSGGGSSSTKSNNKTTDRGKSQKEKLDQFKKSSGVSVDSGSDSVTAGEFAKVLEAIANNLLFVEGSKLESENVDSKRKRFENEIYKASYTEYTEVVSRNGIQRICEKYGVDWQSDVIEQVVQNQDIDENTGKMQDPDDYVVNISRGKKVELSDFHRACIALGEIIAFPRVAKKEIGDPSNKKQKIMRETSSEVAAKAIDFAGLFGVPTIAEKNGINWDSDVMEKVGAK